MTYNSFNIGDSLPTIMRSISQEVIDQYAEASGDFNPIHIDQQFAKNSPFNSKIAHGLMIAASISHMLSETFGISWANSGQLSLRFRNPVLQGDSISTFGQIENIVCQNEFVEIDCNVGVKKNNGQDAITGQAKIIYPIERGAKLE